MTFNHLDLSGLIAMSFAIGAALATVLPSPLPF